MNKRVKIHEIVSGKYLQHEECWTLVTDERGARCVVRERHSTTPFSKEPTHTSHEMMTVSTAIACGGPVAAKLRAVLDV